MNSRVHPKYKPKYRVSNWTEYDRALVQRGNITLWISDGAISAWKPAPTGQRGAQRKFSDHAIPARGVSKDPPARPYYDVAPERTL